jgi:hypothetical protein
VDVSIKFCIIEPVRNLSTKHILKTLLNVVFSPVKQTHSALNTTHDKDIGTTQTEAFLAHKSKSLAEAWLLNTLRIEVEILRHGRTRQLRQ